MTTEYKFNETMVDYSVGWSVCFKISIRKISKKIKDQSLTLSLNLNKLGILNLEEKININKHEMNFQMTIYGL